MPALNIRSWPKHRTVSVALVAAAMSVSGCLASTQQEVELGADYASQINRQLPLVSDPEVVRYITLLGDSLTRVSDDRNLQWHFYVVNDAEINAFAVPGGYVYVNRGLIERAQNLSQLAGVMGHEIGHVVKRHSMKQMRDAERAQGAAAGLCIFAPGVCANEAAATAIQVGGSALFAKFSRGDEEEADKEGVVYTTRAHIDPHGIPGMFRILLDERKTNPSGVETWFASHPLEENRIASTSAQIDKLDQASLRGLTVDSPAFQTFKRRLASLPAAPKRVAK